MSYLTRIIYLALLVQLIHGQSIRYQSENDDVFYKDEPVTFTCDLRLEEEQMGKLIGFGLYRFNDRQVFGCTFVKMPGTPGNSQPIAITGENNVDFDKSSCGENHQALTTDGAASMQFTATISQPGSTYACVTYDDEFSYNGDNVTVSQLYVAPVVLNMKLSDTEDKVYAGDVVDINCMSAGGDPVAEFEYGLFDDKLDTSTLMFPAEAQHNGNQYWCRNIAHPKYKGGDNDLTYATQTLTVYYFSATKPEINYQDSNPAINNKVDCPTESNLPEGVTVTYSWTRNGVPVDDGDSMVLTIPSQEINETTSELFTCTATPSDAKLAAVTIAYNITFDDKTSIPPTTVPTTSEATTKQAPKIVNKEKTSGGEDDKSTTMIIIIVVVVVTVVILIVVIVIIVIKRKSSAGSGEVSKDAGSPPKKTDPEAQKGDEATTLLNQPSQGEPAADEAGKQ